MKFESIWKDMMDLALNQIHEHKIPVEVVQGIFQEGILHEKGQWVIICRTLQKGSFDAKVEKELNAACDLVKEYGGEVTFFRPPESLGSLALKDSIDLATALAMIYVRESLKEEFLNRLCG